MQTIVAVLFACSTLTQLTAQTPQQPAAQAKPVATTHPEATRAAGPVHALRVTLLSTNVTDAGIGEWGFSALVEADGHRILFDTGTQPETVLKNAKELGIDLSDVEDVVLSHFHGDHTGGLLTLRKTFAQRNSAALSRAYVGKGFFWSRPNKGREVNQMIAERPRYEAMGGRFIETAEPRQLYPGVWLSGAVQRVHPEHNWGPPLKVQTPQGITDDYVPEDISLFVDTDAGLAVITGCGHAGIINTLEFARARVRDGPIDAVIGGFHLIDLDDTHLDWTVDQFRRLGVRNVVGAHCTGIEAIYRIRQRAGLARKNCVVGATGSSFTLDKGIDPRDLAR